VVFYLVYRGGGLSLLTALCASAVVAGWWLVWRQCRCDAVERLLLLGVALPVSTLTWSVRPQMAIVLLPVVVSLVARNRALPIALVMALWANLHAGFIMGVLVLVAGVAAAALFDRAVLSARLRVAVAGIAGTFLTPLGLTNWREIAASLDRSQANAIIEWQAPGLGGPYLFFWIAAAVFLVLLLMRGRRLDSPYAQVSALATCLAFLSATRAMCNVPAFMMLALPALSAMLFDAPRQRAANVLGGMPFLHRWLLQGTVIGAAALGVARLWNQPTASMDWRPISQAAQAAVAECPSPMFNTYGNGGPIIWFVPSQPVFVDSRQDPYPVSLVQEAVRVEQTGDYRHVFKARGIGCAVLPPESPAVAALQRDGWRTRHTDARMVVLERPGGH